MGEEVTLDKVRFREMDVQKIMGYGVIIIIPPRAFQHSSRWYCRGKEVETYEFGAVTYGIRSRLDLTNSHLAITWLLNTYRRTSLVKSLSYTRLG
jgi:hypothetical protein